MCRNAVAIGGGEHQPDELNKDIPNSISTRAGQSNDVTYAYIRLANLRTYPLDRLSRYEASLWRQAGQICLRSATSIKENDSSASLSIKFPK